MMVLSQQLAGQGSGRPVEVRAPIRRYQSDLVLAFDAQRLIFEPDPPAGSTYDAG